MQTPTNIKHRRKFWFIPRFSLRTFLVLCTLIGAVLGSIAYRIRQQIYVIGELENRATDLRQGEPHEWLTILPKSWLNLVDGNWCRKVDYVELIVSPSSSATPNEDVLSFSRAINLLPKLQNLRHLKIAGIPNGQSEAQWRAMFAPLADVTGLEQITIGHGDAKNLDVVFAGLPILPELRTLWVWADETLTNQGIAELHKFPQLEGLKFNSSQVDGKCLQSLSSLRHIKDIRTVVSAFSSADLQCFINHPTLEYFYTATPCTDELLKILGSCPNMRVIYAGRSLVTDDGLDHLKSLRRLEELYLEDTSISDAGLAHLASCTQLKSLSCAGCKITDAVGSTLSQFSKLKSLNLDRTLVTQNLMPQLRGLRELEFFDAPNITMDASQVIDFCAGHPSLQEGSGGFDWKNASVHLIANIGFEELKLPNVRGLSGRIERMRDVRTVKSVDLRGSDINDDDLRNLAAKCNLESVDIRETSITPQGLSVLSSEPSLRELRVGPFDDADEAVKVISKFPALMELGFSGADRLSQVGRDYLLDLNGLESLYAGDCAFDEVFVRKLAAKTNLRDAYWLDRICIRNEAGYRISIPEEEDGIPRGMQRDFVDIFGLHEVKIESESELNALGQRSVRELDVSGVSLSRAGIDAIVHLPGIESLNLCHTGLTDELLQPLGAMSNLGKLNLSDNPISDNAAQTLIRLRSLDTLNLAGTLVTDAGVLQTIPSLKLHNIDLSRTSITEDAWQLIANQTRCVSGIINIGELDAAPNIIKKIAEFPVDALPIEIRTHGLYGISHDALLVMSGRKHNHTLTEVDITPEILKVWELEQLLANKEFLDCIHIVETGRVAQVLATVARQCPNLRQIVFVSEQLDAISLEQLPHRTREIYFKDCSLSNEAIGALLRCKWLSTLYFDSCKLQNCSLEPCTRMPFLARMTIIKTELSPEQRTMLASLRPSLVEAAGW